MTKRKIIALIALADFAALNIWAFSTAGLSGFIEYATTATNAWHWVVLVDLVIALSMVLAWMFKDAKKHGRNVVPYTIVTLATGSIGPLAYFVAEPKRDSEQEDVAGLQSTPALS